MIQIISQLALYKNGIYKFTNSHLKKFEEFCQKAKIFYLRIWCHVGLKVKKG
jgi:hypothetical protein